MNQLRLAFADLADGLRAWPIWGMLGWQDVRQRYRRSILGPLWLTLSMGVMVGALGYVYGDLFKTPLDDYLPFLTVGFVAWNLISTLVIDSCTAFIGATGYIRQLRLPVSLYLFRLCWRNLIIFFHNALVFVAVALIFKVVPTWQLLWLLPGLAIILYTGFWSGLVLGALCARFRDIPQVVSSLVQVVFFMTPILWKPELLTSRPVFVQENPFFHFVELIRGPMLGNGISLQTWAVTLGCALLGSLVAFFMFARLRRRIAFWV
ncbi:ABC transporter permease [Methylotetracoccus oryzae]|uniref:ABC transporter permease n=1 Tax=Methylotetracoccus oryzae TaxID=1919059 RepID=UPI001118557C|nr:ABC transporter permease [Methylotetracoccus oryzae]